MKGIDFNDNIVKKNKIPILIYTPEWIQLFENNRSRNLNKAVNKLEEYLSKEKSLEGEQKDIERRKKIIMNKILHLSSEINEKNNKNAIPKLEEAQNELLRINERLPRIIEELEIIPQMINNQNTIVLKETIQQAYELIKSSKNESAKCQFQVNDIRKKLGNLIRRKVELDEDVNKLYSFIHGMVGADEMEKLDGDYLK